MNVSQGVLERRSIRAFSVKVPERSLVESILGHARWAPSWGNTQCWKVTVADGDRLEAFRENNRRQYLDGVVPNPDMPMPREWPEINKARYGEVGRRVFEALSIARGDKQARHEHQARMHGLFGAPMLLLFSVDRAITPPEYAMFDLGSFVQTICLLSWEKGLGTCPLAVAVNYPDVVRRHIDIPEGEALVMGLAVGYPDMAAPINSFERSRASEKEVIRWGA
ncbi:MAG: nitroreductase [Syntrophales bacterium]|jgi:nitroreductase|nr:nitroreductase [Syntrophales bacterium]MCK9527245.1 nitroreductase [Syntrophales bacterium]MDX9921285.1 nitroreductase [Syntrophales bacterium]